MDSVKTLSPRQNSPWGSPLKTVAPCSLSAVMDEELARTLQDKEDSMLQTTVDVVPSKGTPTMTTPTDDNTSSDLLLAQMLQLEFDKEHDRNLKREEKQYNQHNKVKISFENYRSLHDYYQKDDEREREMKESDDEETKRDWEGYKPRISSIKSGRRKGVSPGHPTKHDEQLCGRRNVENMEKFPPDYPVGDLDLKDQDLRLSNKVFNTLKEHSQKELKHSQKLHEKKDHSTSEHALDSKTRLLLFKMVDNGRLTEINGCISTGKESAVYHALGGESEDGVSFPTECAIKVYKTTLNEFFRRDKYIKDDYRFKNRFNKQNPRKIIKMWAEKEMHNLNRLHRYGIPCPQVALLRKHVLIMSFIGRDQVPAPKLKDVQLKPDQWASAYHQCVQSMERMYKDCHIIHADLSEYNMLWFEGRVYFIDVSQSVEPSNPHGLELLLRDCKNVTGFFAGKGVPDVPTAHELFNRLTGLDINAINDQEFVAQIRVHTQRQQLMDTLYDKKQYPFDYFFEESCKNRMKQLPKHQAGKEHGDQRGLEEMNDSDNSSLSSGEEGSLSENEN